MIETRGRIKSSKDGQYENEYEYEEEEEEEEGPSGTSNTMTARKEAKSTHISSRHQAPPPPRCCSEKPARRSPRHRGHLRRGLRRTHAAANRFVWTGTGPLGRSDSSLGMPRFSRSFLSSHCPHDRGCTAVCLWWRCRSLWQWFLDALLVPAVVVERPMTHILFAIL